MAKKYYRKVKGVASLNKISGLECSIEFKEIIDYYGKKTAEILRQTSPQGNRGRYTPYFAGWTFHIDKKADDNYGGKVWNETNYQLTYLLENGHLIVNKIGGVGWASPHPHINKAFQKVKDPFVKAMKNAEIKTQFK